MNHQKGFTLVELVIVIVILGVLAAVAVPKFIDLSEDAEISAIQGVAATAGSAMAINYAGCAVARHTPGAKCTTVSLAAGAGPEAQETAAKTAVAPVLTGGWPAAYTVNCGADAVDTNGETATCTVTKTGTSATATFNLIAAGNP